MDITKIYPELKPEKPFKELNNDILMKIISDNKGTEYGKLHDFARIKSPEDYRRKVGINGYEEFRPFMDRVAEGEKGCFQYTPNTVS